jgi:hypothetical protein
MRHLTERRPGVWRITVSDRFDDAESADASPAPSPAPSASPSAS